MPKLIRTHSPSNPRSQRSAGSASLRRGSPIPGSYYTDPVFAVNVNEIKKMTIFLNIKYGVS